MWPFWNFDTCNPLENHIKFWYRFAMGSTWILGDNSGDNSGGNSGVNHS